MDELKNVEVRFAKNALELINDIILCMDKAIDTVVTTLKNVDKDSLEFTEFASYIPDSIRKAQSNVANSYIKKAQDDIEKLKVLKDSLSNASVQVPNPYLFNFVIDGGVMKEIDDIFAFIEETKTAQPYLDYKDSLTRYNDCLIEIIKLAQDPDYYQYVKDPSTAKFDDKK